MSIKDTYIQYGVRSDWAHEYERIGISASTFKSTPKKSLIKNYGIPKDQIDFVYNCLKRKPIDSATIQKLLENSNFLCCLCKGDKSDAFIIHHIVEYSITQDNSYNNLAVLCPNDHELAHREGIALAAKISVEQIKLSKKNWEKKVKTENKKKAIRKPIRGKIRDWKNKYPFIELSSYTEGEEDCFFGRKKEIEDLLQEIYKNNIVGLFGESGTGKTSIINAGLIPKLKNEAFIVVSVRCLSDPIKRIRESLRKAFIEYNVNPESIEKIFEADDFPALIIELNSIIEKENRSLIVVIDQFEELFTRANEREREQLSKGIMESLIACKGKISFLLSLREDYIGSLWDWSHRYKLEAAWLHQYRIKRLDDEKAYEVITEPLFQLGINVDQTFIQQLINELKLIGDGLIYPPYLQIVCSKLFEEYKNQNTTEKPSILFDKKLYKENDSAGAISADYLSESMLDGLTAERKAYVLSVLDTLTGDAGLRAFLTIDEISRYTGIEKNESSYIIEHLIKKKIVHAVMEADSVNGYELVHDFLSKKFFEKLGAEAKEAKTTKEIFRKAFQEWSKHGILASKSSLEIISDNIDQLNLNHEEWKFLIESSFSFFWWPNKNNLLEIINTDILIKICTELIEENNEENKEDIAKNAIRALGGLTDNKLVPFLVEIIKSPTKRPSIRETAIDQFAFYLFDLRVLNPLKDVIQNSNEYKLRKSAIYAFARNLSRLTKPDDKLRDTEIDIIYIALNDQRSHVRKQAADVLSQYLVNKKSIIPLIDRLKVEFTVLPRKAMINALGKLLNKQGSTDIISPILKKIVSSKSEDDRVKGEAKRFLKK